MRERDTTRRIRVLPIIRGIRMRWRLKMFLRGLSIVLGTGFLAFLLSAYGLEAARFSPTAVTAFRWMAWIAVLALTFFFLLRPLFRRISDEQVALYLEEHEPTLEAAILGAVEVEKNQGSAAQGASPQLLNRLVERAVDRARAVDYGRDVDRRGLYQGTGALAIVSVAMLLFLLLGPTHLRWGMRALVVPTTNAAEVSPYSVAVLPGDVTLARGSDQLITAELRGFDSDDVSLFSRGEGDVEFQRLSMLPADSATFDLLLLNLVEETDYFVEANGVRSATYTIEVADLPYVQEMLHTYYFPAFTGLRPREVEDGGDIAALAGTRVEIRIQPTIPTPGGQLFLDDSLVMELVPDEDGMLAGEIQIREDGAYRIELARADGRMVEASPEYTIDVLVDMPPTVAISEPGRDAAVSAIEEVFIEARADDDYGISDLRLVYSVNGEPEDTVALFAGGRDPLQEVSAGYTLFLEEWELDDGDMVSYYAVAADNRNGRRAEAMSDIYFVTIRPFRRDFRQAEQNQNQNQGQGQGQGMGGQGGMGSLSELQREVIAATFNLQRDREIYSAQEFSENAVSVALAQSRVRDEVANLSEQMTSRGIAQADEHMQEIARLLPLAIADMESAESLLREEEPREALPPEQRALTFLLKAEETYERTVGQQQGGQRGGQGGNQGASAEELADLFEMELDKLQNQYETVQRGERQQADEEVDELMERLKELARRQQQELERQRRRNEAQQGAAGGSGGQSQRELAEQTEETARQLAELARRTGDQELAETARRLQEAAETMRQSAANSGRGQGVANATSALDDLEEAQRRLERNQEDRLGEGIADAQRRVDQLARDQEAVRERLEELPGDPMGRAEGVQEIHERKDEMIRNAEELQRDLIRMQQAAQGENQEAARALNEAVEAIREGKLREKLAYTKGVVEQREREFALDWEDQISEDIGNLRREVEEAAQAFEEGAPDREMQEALDQARELVRGAESLGRRLQNRGASGQQGQEGQEGQEGQQGQQGQQGQEGQPGQQGQQGQQGGQGGRGGGQPGDSTSTGQEGRGGGQPGDSASASQQGRLPGAQGDSTGAGRPGGGQGDTAGRLQSGEPSPFGGATRGTPEPLTEEEIRQFTREFAQRLAQARELEQALNAAGRDTEDLREAMEAMDELRDPETYGDLPQIAALQERIRENLKRVEFLLRRELEGEGAGRAALTGSNEVPEGFRRLVEEYFKNLARRGGDGGGG